MPERRFWFIMSGMGKRHRIRFAEYPSPVGKLLIARGELGITELSISAVRRDFFKRLKDRYGVDPVEDRSSFNDAFRELDSYFSGRSFKFTLPLELTGTGFEMKVWGAIKKIPWGETRSYKEIAERIGSPGASRAVGGACGANPIPLIIPCHRVINSNGGLGGYTGGLAIKKRLLSIEGII